MVTLASTVNSEVIKQAKGAEAQAFFGAVMTVNNQLKVKVVEASPVATA
jgi:hypothetical protein